MSDLIRLLLLSLVVGFVSAGLPIIITTLYDRYLEKKYKSILAVLRELAKTDKKVANVLTKFNLF